MRGSQPITTHMERTSIIEYHDKAAFVQGQPISESLKPAEYTNSERRHFLRKGRLNRGQDIAPAYSRKTIVVPESKTSQTLTVVSFNCKNTITSNHIIDRLVRSTNAILLQEHWLFDCQLTTLKEINEGYVGTGKAVDSTDPIMPVHMP